MGLPVADSAFNILQFLQTPEQLTLIDNNTANITYIGVQPWGTLTNAPVCTITKTTMNCDVAVSLGVVTISNVGSGTQTITQRCSNRSGGTWENRTSETYNTLA